jgi:hypothetical protein
MARSWRRGLVVSSPPAELWVVRSNPVRVQGGSVVHKVKKEKKVTGIKNHCLKN